MSNGSSNPSTLLVPPPTDGDGVGAIAVRVGTNAVWLWFGPVVEEEVDAMLLLIADRIIRFDTGGGFGKFGMSPGWEDLRDDLRCAKERIGEGGDVQLPRVLSLPSDPVRFRFDSEARFEDPACEYNEAAENVENGRVGNEIDVLVRLTASKLERVAEEEPMAPAGK